MCFEYTIFRNWKVAFIGEQLDLKSRAVVKDGVRFLYLPQNEHVANIGHGLRLQNVINAGSIPAMLSNGAIAKTVYAED